MNRWNRLWQDENAQGLVEYGLILSVVVVAAVVILTTLRDAVLQLYTHSRAAVTDALQP